MKKTITLYILLTTWSIANASIEFGDHIECQKTIGHFSPKLKVEIIAPLTSNRTDGLIKFNVSAWGHSRNTYAATYIANIKGEYDNTGHSYHLKKWEDYSTWSDMPENLSFHSLNGLFLFQGKIPGKGFIKTYLDKNDCIFNQN